MGLVTIFYCLRFETSLFVASYDTQGYGGGIRPRLHMGIYSNSRNTAFCNFQAAQIEVTVPYTSSVILWFIRCHETRFDNPLSSNGFFRHSMIDFCIF
jgi:hypothetical protein